MGYTPSSIARCLILASLFNTVLGLIPGLDPRGYAVNESIEIKVNSLTSVKAQIPFRYYALPYCQPQTLTSHMETIGEVLLGSTLENSPYEARMMETKTCQLLCRKPLNDFDKALFRRMIDDEYFVNWIADGLPAVFPHPLATSAADKEFYALGFPVGWKEADPLSPASKYYLNNYISIIFKVHPVSSEEDAENQKYYIVGFETVPISFNDKVDASLVDAKPDCSAFAPFTPVESSLFLRQAVPPAHFLNIDEATSVTYIYDIKFQEVDYGYGARWDTYLMSQRLSLDDSNREIHWFAIINSLVIVIVLSALVGMILLRALRRDIARYNDLVLNAEEHPEETGWKLVHGDVFRKPAHSTILAALAGSGAQVVCMVLAVLLLGLIGVCIYPSTGFGRGRLLQIALFLWALMGTLGGYTAARFYKLFQSPNWKMTTVRTALLYPGTVFTVFLFLNALLRLAGSSAAVPFSIIFLLFFLWFGVSTPLVFVGAYFGFKAPALSIPVRVNKIPRQIPPQPWIIHPVVICFAGGALPFGAVITELTFVFSAIWLHRAYMLFGFLLLVALILIITCAEVAITMTYFQLAWSFLTCGFSAIYVMAYSIVYLITRLRLTHFTSIAVYIGDDWFYCLLSFHPYDLRIYSSRLVRQPEFMGTAVEGHLTADLFQQWSAFSWHDPWETAEHTVTVA